MPPSIGRMLPVHQGASRAKNLSTIKKQLSVSYTFPTISTCSRSQKGDTYMTPLATSLAEPWWGQ